MPRRSQANTQKIAINASAVDHSHLDHTPLDRHQQLQQIEQQLQLQQQQLQQQQQEQFQQQHQLQQFQSEQGQQAAVLDNNDNDNDNDEEEEDEQDDEEDDDDDKDSDGAAAGATIPAAPPLRSNGAVGRNVNLTNNQRKAICQMRIDNPDMTLSALGLWAQKEYNLFRAPAMGTLSRIVHKNEIYNSMNDLELQVQRKRAVLCPELEDALLEWIRECQEREIHISYRMITKKGFELGTHIRSMPGRETFALPSFSNGWVSGFTKRNGLLGASLNPATSIQAMPEDEFTASESFRPFSTNQQLVERVLQPRFRPRVLTQPQRNNHSMIVHSHDQQDHGGDIEMESALSDMHTDLHHQVIHAVASSTSYSTTQSAVPDMPEVLPASPVPETPVKKTRARKPRNNGVPTTTPRRRGKAAKTAETADAAAAAHMEDVVDAADQHFQSLNLQQQQQQQQPAQHQIHPATPGLNNFRARAAGDRVPPTETSSLLGNPLAHPAQALHQLQQQQQQQLQTILQQPTVPLTGGSSNSDLVAAVSAAAAAESVATTTRPTPTTSEVMSAIRIVIESLNVNIPAEVELFKPLFDMERRLQNQIHANDRQAGIMSWPNTIINKANHVFKHRRKVHTDQAEKTLEEKKLDTLLADARKDNPFPNSATSTASSSASSSESSKKN
ncbi:hypothetical protein BG015_010973 [Linnemannia schmuckeri]|uniref:HTH CENPB-type domain-containing protein n=1 Tax=Linnemannia schmuckeri TaxID=64567 RepID=A0A9P5RWT5_9FUNG|nr:hypothetical protein BG015_010973 [Linnemannia schmuckeri]